MKPTRDEILEVIADIEADTWIDPSGDELMFYWCNLYKDDMCVGDGSGYSPGEAMAYAWVHAHDPEALCRNHVTEDIPLSVGEGWCFELGRPGEPLHRPPRH
jgi:hypothetical protein